GLLWTRRFALGRWIVLGAALFSLAAGVLPLGPWALKPIEDRFPPPSLPERVAGIIVLGGAVDPFVIGKRGIPRSLASIGSPRLDAFLDLVRRYPSARHVFTGGTIAPGADGSEAEAVKRIFERIGVDTSRLVFEDKSRNTYENAVFSRDLVKPGLDEAWILVTASRHMPRAIGAFRKAGWRNVIAFPIDYATDAALTFDPEFGLGSGLHTLAEAIREYIGLAAYYVLGRSSALFPAP
ncbi:MAG: YdcF family protein, partial [Pseudomonadota bacterium]